MSLKREFNNRLLNKLDFQLQEIQNFIYATIRGYAALERQALPNHKVRMAHIFMGLKTRDSSIKVIDSELLEKASNLELMRRGGFRDPQNHDIYLAPEEFTALVAGEEELGEEGK